MELQTERLILREFKAGDVRDVIVYQSQPRFADYYNGDRQGGADDTLRLIEMFVYWSVESPRENYQFAMAERSSPATPIGSCGIRCKGLEKGWAEFGIELAPQHWGRGLATEGARACLAFGFHNLGLHTVIAKSVTQNTRVSHLLKKLGFRVTSVVNGAEWIRERGWSQSEWQITADEWEALSISDF